MTDTWNKPYTFTAWVVFKRTPLEMPPSKIFYNNAPLRKFGAKQCRSHTLLSCSPFLSFFFLLVVHIEHLLHFTFGRYIYLIVSSHTAFCLLSGSLVNLLPRPCSKTMASQPSATGQMFCKHAQGSKKRKLSANPVIKTERVQKSQWSVFKDSAENTESEIRHWFKFTCVEFF